MMRLMTFLGCVFVMLPFYLVAGPSIENKVIFVGVNSNNNVFVQFEKNVEELGCSGKQLVIDKSNPVADRVMSVALSAKATNATVIIKAKGCVGGSPSLKANASDWGWFYIQ